MPDTMPSAAKVVNRERRKEVECHQCGNSDMRLTNLDLEKYSSMSEEERADYSDAWLYIHKQKG